MRIVTLMENTAALSEMQARHGICFYIETKNHKILFDMGPDGGFVENAQKLNIDLGKVDTAILSHGHYDHGGGMAAFFEVNEQASIHMQKKAFGEFYSHNEAGERRYIGLPRELKDHPRITYHTGDYKLDAGLQVFAGVTGRECYSPANDRLTMEIHGREIPDLFMHEQNLLIKEGEKMVLVAGCAHNGIVNIIKKAKRFAPGGIDVVIGGMHLKNAFPEEEKTKAFCRELAVWLSAEKSRYYTCHCTGTEAYRFLHEEMGERMLYLAAGNEVRI